MTIPGAKRYDIGNWYWIVAGDNTRVYSSAVGNYVPANNAAFVAWQADGNTPTRIDTEANLGAVLTDGPIPPIAANILDGYKTKQAGSVIDKLEFRLLFNHENRLRAIERNLGLNGSPPNLTQQQALAAVKALL